MTKQEKITMNAEAIRKAVEDYFAHTYDGEELLENMSDYFVERLARDNYESKQELRELFRKSPAWNEELDALVINGNRTHEPEYNYIFELAQKIFWNYVGEHTPGEVRDLHDAIEFFAVREENSEKYIEALEKVAPGVYVKGKKRSRIFKALCDRLGVSDNTAGSDFQRYFAKIADEMNSKTINYKLFVSLNPAHFLTMSNPKSDSRGAMMTSCHSLNSDYEYKNGCTGYARDNVTMIAFTVENPDDAEALNNRKTTRQLFMYKPGNGLLLQSRMYNTSGGTRGAQAESKEYRDLIQRELSYCEEAVNLWVTKKYHSTNYNFPTGEGFGGYADWDYSEFVPMVSVRKDMVDEAEDFEVGAAGLCFSCGGETERGNWLFCDDCDGDHRCAECDEHCDSDDLYTVYRDGEEYQVCSDCLNNYYYYCEECNEYHHYSECTEVNDRMVCDDCLERYYVKCDDCDTWVRESDTYTVYRDGEEQIVCENCYENNYYYCEECGDYHHEDDITTVHDVCGNEVSVCESCRDDYYEECDECGEWFHQDNMKDGLCEDCYDEKHENDEEEIA